MSTVVKRQLVYGLALCVAIGALVWQRNGFLLGSAFGAEDGASPVVSEPIESGSADMVRVRIIGPDGKLTEPVSVPKVELSEAEWQKRLTPAQYKIVRAKGTEPAFCGTLLNNHESGFYVCVGCNLPLFQSKAKFESGTGWPSFFDPLAAENIEEHKDTTFGMVRVEILCARCGGHLGHVFDDGPPPTGKRYCLNSESLKFVKDADIKTIAETIPAPASADSAKAPKVGDRLPAAVVDEPKATAPGEEKAVFAGGCFWCTEAVFEQLKGVKDVTSGYSGGDAATANYDAVCTGTTGHAESIQITYDPSVVSFGQLLRIFFATHNPMTKNQQGPDRGTQYRSAIFYTNDKQKEVAEAYIKQLTDAKSFANPIVTSLEPFKAFYPAEQYHQDFVKNNPNYPYVRQWADPKLDKLREYFSDELKPGAATK